MDYSPPGSSVHGILQARILEWVAIPFSRESSQPRLPAFQAESLWSEPPGKPYEKKIELKAEVGPGPLTSQLLVGSMCSPAFCCFSRCTEGI